MVRRNLIRLFPIEYRINHWHPRFNFLENAKNLRLRIPSCFHDYLLYLFYRSLSFNVDLFSWGRSKSTVLTGQEERIFLILNELSGYFLKLLNDEELFKAKANNHNYYCGVFTDFLNDMNYPEETNQGQIISDFIAGMTDNFAMDCFQDLFVVQRVI